MINYFTALFIPPLTPNSTPPTVLNLHVNIESFIIAQGFRFVVFHSVLMMYADDVCIYVCLFGSITAKHDAKSNTCTTKRLTTIGLTRALPRES